MDACVAGVGMELTDSLCCFFLLKGSNNTSLSLHHCLACLSLVWIIGMNQCWIRLVLVMAGSCARHWLFKIAGFLVRIQFPRATTVDALSSSSSFGLIGNKNWSLGRHLSCRNKRSRTIAVIALAFGPAQIHILVALLPYLNHQVQTCFHHCCCPEMLMTLGRWHRSMEVLPFGRPMFHKVMFSSNLLLRNQDLVERYWKGSKLDITSVKPLSNGFAKKVLKRKGCIVSSHYESEFGNGTQSLFLSAGMLTTYTVCWNLWSTTQYTKIIGLVSPALLQGSGCGEYVIAYFSG